ncbi:MAG TPA: OmpA family protein, partial [Leptospiraceae bacterium]|nr:OmpA family protein [Leptospiraceae bacterium]
MSYYKTIKGKKYDKELLDMAEEFVSGKGDGRISLAEAKKLIEAVKDGNEYTDVEKRTVEYIRNNYTFTESADKWFRTEIRKWAAGKSSDKKTTAKKKTSSEPKKKESPGTKNEETIPLIEDIHTVQPPAHPTSPAIAALVYEEQKVSEKAKIPVWLIFGLAAVCIGLLIYGIRLSCSSVKKSDSAESRFEESPGVKKTEESFSAEDIEKTKFSFQKGKAVISPDSEKALEKIASILKKNSDLKLKITGHSCDSGTKEKNKVLSLERATLAKDFLVKKGIEEKRILSEGKGDSEPVSSNETEEGRS